ncbi:hypothetical protein PM082_017945 [Marasmius tenuissimus]|nr:hypothetical protein PM082_017945 [Marasmius tenuissimus]
MYIQVQEPSQNDTSSISGDLESLNVPQCDTRSTCFLIATVTLLLIFYALALWDRYINLRLREVEKQTRMLIHSTPVSFPNYGATSRTSSTESMQYLTVPTDKRVLYGERPPQASFTTKDPEANPPSSIQLLVPEMAATTKS